MTGLKTLKGISCGNRSGAEASICANCGKNHTVTEEWLKKEVVKWVKDIRSNLDENVPGECKDCIGLICWIKHFFNISEEDLK